MTKIIQHGLKCPDCGDEIYSNYNHDYRQCKCKLLAVDGGRIQKDGTHSYHRIIGDALRATPVEREVYLVERTPEDDLKLLQETIFGEKDD